MFGILIFCIMLFTIHAMPNYDTTGNQVNKLEIPTATSQIFEHTTDQLLENKTTSILNVISVSMMATDTSIIPNSTAISVAIAGKVVTYNTTYNYVSYTTKSSPGLSGSTIAGIVINVVLLCCCGICRCCIKWRLVGCESLG